jgi:hypothetical protein
LLRQAQVAVVQPDRAAQPVRVEMVLYVPAAAAVVVV